MQATAVILAAGLGTRMKSALPKTLHRIAGRTMLRHLLASCEQVFDRIVVVVGPDMEAVQKEAAPHPCAVQQERLGTAHAALAAADYFGDGEVAVLYADNPLIRPDTLRRLLQRRQNGDARLALLAFRPAGPGRYGRVIARHGTVERIVEWADASEEVRAIALCNAGVLCAGAADMRRWLNAIRANNAKGEYYLTDAVALAVEEGMTVAAVEASAEEVAGINSRAELAAAEAVVQSWLRAAAMDAGVTMIDPGSVFLCADTKLGQDVIIEPNVVFGPGVSVASGALVRSFSHLEGCHIGPGCSIGPHARLRPGAELDANVHIGNFVEVKAAHLAAGVKANHLSYLGDADVGEATNIGAGTITCNYDGSAKHRTRIGARSFIGSDVTLVAPVTVGDGVYVAAGSTITEDVEADAFAIARGRQATKPGRAAAMRAANKDKR
ncbi:MAG TPA: bifunctional UDP-N-acetylglucosamine diphosphorylase/glucosamine-1-phosphate N-acetyltransferase GlmU [Acetobacteraceae bacterium]|nr:bifunctional UDP-N-acetylglucosamine diphosphorylase/glucosamine-1-phosphate N-acetyltransferase GlmU [Acetobacteraceae bacterium]